MTPEENKTDKLGIWNEGDQVMPGDWLQATAGLRTPVEEIEPEASARPESLWWRVSVVTLTASLLGFTLGASAGHFREPDLAAVSPWQQLLIDDAQDAPRAASSVKNETHKVARRTDSSRSIKLAVAAKPRVSTKVKGILIARASSSAYAPVAVANATASRNGRSRGVVLIKRPSNSGGSSRPARRANNPAPNPTEPEPTPEASPTTEAEEEAEDDSSDRRSRSSDNDDPDPADDNGGDPEPDPGDNDEAEEPSEPEEDSGPGNSENAPGHNKDKGDEGSDPK